MPTDAEVSGLNLQLTPVENLIFDGLQRSFLRVFKTPAVWSTSTDKVKAIASLFNGHPIRYPYAVLSLSSTSEAVDRFNVSNTARRGTTVVVSSDQKRSFRVQFIPVDFEVSVEFYSNSYQNLLTFSNEWLFARRLGWLKFEVAYGSKSFSIGIEQEPNLSIPQREADPNESQEYLLTTILKIVGHISYATLIEGQIKDTVSVSTSIIDNSSSAVVWSFIRSPDLSMPIPSVSQRN
jgi:hypothetical protein